MILLLHHWPELSWIILSRRRRRRGWAGDWTVKILATIWWSIRGHSSMTMMLSAWPN